MQNRRNSNEASFSYAFNYNNSEDLHFFRLEVAHPYYIFSCLNLLVAVPFLDSSQSDR